MPAWAQVLNALSLPLIAAVGAFLAWQQMRIAKAKLTHDLFDRRFAVFQAARIFLSEIFRKAHVSDEALWNYRAGIGEAVFLLDDELRDYLEEIYKAALKMRMHRQQYEGIPPIQERSVAVEAEHEQLSWLIDQLPILVERFKPFLKLEDR